VVVLRTLAAWTLSPGATRCKSKMPPPREASSLDACEHTRRARRRLRHIENVDSTVCVAPTRYTYVRAYVLCFPSLGTPSLGGGVSRL